MQFQRVVFEIYELTHTHTHARAHARTRTDRQTDTLIAMLRVPTGGEVTRPTLPHNTFCILEFEDVDDVGSPVVLPSVVLPSIDSVLRVGTVAQRICSTHIEFSRRC